MNSIFRIKLTKSLNILMSCYLTFPQRHAQTVLEASNNPLHYAISTGYNWTSVSPFSCPLLGEYF